MPDPVPIVLLARLAVARSEQGRHLGGHLLVDALRRCVRGGRDFGARAVVVDAINDEAMAFYEHFDFHQLEGRRLWRRRSDVAPGGWRPDGQRPGGLPRALAAPVDAWQGGAMAAEGPGRGGPSDRLEQRVIRAAEEALARQRFVAPVDVLMGLGWLHQSQVDAWRQGRVEYLERVVDANLAKISKAMGHFRRFARDRGLTPSETAYLARTRDHRPLRFSRSGAPAIEQAYRTHWVAADLSPARRERLRERQSRPPDLVVIVSSHDWSCRRCGAEQWRGSLLLMEDPGPVCMTCAGFDRLVFLGAGDATLTRRARRYSGQSVVVVRFSRARKRYERQGLLVEEAALARAERECTDDGGGQARDYRGGERDR